MKILIYFVLEGKHAGLAAISVLSSPSNSGRGSVSDSKIFNLNTYRQKDENEV